MFNYVSAANSTVSGWPGLKGELHQFFREAKPHARQVLDKQRQKIQAASNKNVVHTYNIRTNKWSEKKSETPAALPLNSPSQSNALSTSNDSEDGSTQKQTGISASISTAASSSSGNNVFVIDRRPSKPSQGATTTTKKGGTLVEMFKKQQETEGSQQKSGVPNASKSAKKTNNTPKTLKSMFEKQRAAASTSPLPPTQEMIDVEQEDAEEPSQPANIDGNSSDQSDSQPVAKTNAPPANSFTFKTSPFASDILTPATEVAVGTSQLALSQGQQLASASQLAIQSQACGTMEEEEHLCVVCEDQKKQVMLLPCKHMCLCRTCADNCLNKTIKECPMCRAKIENSMEVFW